MIVPFARRRFKDDDDAGIEGLGAVRAKVVSGVEDKSIDARSQRRIPRHQRAQPAIRIGVASTNRLPSISAAVSLQSDRHAGRRLTGCGVEHVGGDGAHNRRPALDSQISPSR